MSGSLPGDTIAGAWLPAGAGNRIIADDRETTWQALFDEVAEKPWASPVAALVNGHAEALSAVARNVVHGTVILIASAGRIDDEMRESLIEAGFSLNPVATTAARNERRSPATVWIMTSGSTGRPKRVAHTLASLTTIGGDQPERTWLCPYSPGTYAWWQLVSLSLAVPGQHLVTVRPTDLDVWPALAAKHGVTAVSGTPTFWRQTLFRSGAELAALPLEQVTLGGEPVDQAILDRLREAFPSARITWIYASSEVGATIAVHDGRAGFPASWLGNGRLSIDDGELVIASPHAAASVSGAHHTGDRVEMADDRVLITGRAGTDEINVGGTKISAGTVRAVLLAHPRIAWVRVTAARAPIVGHVVAAEVVGDLTADEVRTWAGDRLPEQGVPRRVRLLPEIPMKETLKSDV